MLVMGDSLSAGYGIDQNVGWVNLLQQRLTQRGYNYEVVNASISGETTSSALSHLGDELAHHHPVIVIIELGANDGLRGLPLTDMARNLGRMIERCRAAGAKTLVVGMRLPPNYGPRYTRQFEQVYRRLSKRYDTAFVPFLMAGFAEKTRLFQPDGLHPIAKAQPAMLDNVWPALKGLLTK